MWIVGGSAACLAADGDAGHGGASEGPVGGASVGPVGGPADGGVADPAAWPSLVEYNGYIF